MNRLRQFRFASRAALGSGMLATAFALALTSCGVPKLDADDPLGKRGIVQSVKQALTAQDCNAALGQIIPLYNSNKTDNEIRLLTASAYGCKAKVNFFQLIGDIVSNSSVLAGSGLWALFPKLFPSTTSDSIPESAMFGVDALQAALGPGVVLTSATRVNYGTPNPGSVLAADRIADANGYLAFLTMPAMGGLQSRYGAPETSGYKRTVDLPWKTVATMTADGCAYASALVNFVDGLGATAGVVSGPLGTNLAKIHATFAAALDLACAVGCTAAAVGTGTGWVASDCSATVSCTSCPQALRDRTQCAAAPTTSTNLSACAAAGLVNFINFSPIGWEKSP